MAAQDLNKLATLIRREHALLLSQWRQQVKQLPSAQALDAPTINDHIPSLLEELARAFEVKSDETIVESIRDGSPPAHGLQRVQDGFNIVEVVAEYNILRGCVHDLAEANGLNLEGRAYHILNLVLDGAIGLAVETFAAQRALEVRQRREEYLGFVAHDLRTPLNAISLATRVLEMSAAAEGDEAKQFQIIRTLHRNVRQLETLVAKVLEENSNVEEPEGVQVQRRSLDLWPLVEALIHDMDPVSQKAGTVLLNQVPYELAAYADAGLLRRILQNLLGNAIAYAPRGEVCVGARELPTEGLVEIWVSDNGTGIAGHLLEKVFEKGEGDPAKDASTGLGLAIVKTFVEAHEGTVNAESEVGQGTTIRFTLPSAPAPAKR